MVWGKRVICQKVSTKERGLYIGNNDGVMKNARSELNFQVNFPEAIDHRTIGGS